MSQQNTEENHSTPPNENSQFNIAVDQLINFDTLQDNTLIVLRTDKPTPDTYKLIEYIQQAHWKKLVEKNCNFILLKKDTKLELLSEDKLNKMGLYKKGNIITLS